jgi:hypothetical protein
MAQQSYKPIPRPLPIETRLVLSMLYQVKDRMEIKKWMNSQDIYQAHRMIFDRIAAACRNDYGHPVTVTNHLRAIEILMEGFNKDDVLT